MKQPTQVSWIYAQNMLLENVNLVLVGKLVAIAHLTIQESAFFNLPQEAAKRRRHATFIIQKKGQKVIQMTGLRLEIRDQMGDGDNSQIPLMTLLF